MTRNSSVALVCVVLVVGCAFLPPSHAFLGGLLRHRKTINNDAAIFTAVRSAIRKNQGNTFPFRFQSMPPRFNSESLFSSQLDKVKFAPSLTRNKFPSMQHTHTLDSNPSNRVFNPISELLTAFKQKDKVVKSNEQRPQTQNTVLNQDNSQTFGHEDSENEEPINVDIVSSSSQGSPSSSDFPSVSNRRPSSPSSSGFSSSSNRRPSFPSSSDFTSYSNRRPSSSGFLSSSNRRPSSPSFLGSPSSSNRGPDSQTHFTTNANSPNPSPTSLESQNENSEIEDTQESASTSGYIQLLKEYMRRRATSTQPPPKFNLSQSSEIIENNEPVKESIVMNVDTKTPVEMPSIPVEVISNNFDNVRKPDSNILNNLPHKEPINSIEYDTNILNILEEFSKRPSDANRNDNEPNLNIKYESSETNIKTKTNKRPSIPKDIPDRYSNPESSLLKTGSSSEASDHSFETELSSLDDPKEQLKEALVKKLHETLRKVKTNQNLKPNPTPIRDPPIHTRPQINKYESIPSRFSTKTKDNEVSKRPSYSKRRRPKPVYSTDNNRNKNNTKVASSAFPPLLKKKPSSHVSEKKKVFVTCLLFVCLESKRNILPMSFYKK